MHLFAVALILPSPMIHAMKPLYSVDRTASLGSCQANAWHEFWQYRFALRNLILKDFRIRYRNMSLGVLWSVINPLVMLGILVVIFTFIYPHSGGGNFPVFILIGLVSYNSASLCLQAATGCVVDNAALVKKVVFPHHILPLSVVLSQSVNVVIQVMLVGLFAILFRIPITIHCLWLPLIFLIQLLFVVGAGWAASALNVYFRDVRYIVESLLTVGFWMSPVFYPLSTVHDRFPDWLFGLYILNPLAGCIDASRKVLLDQAPPDMFSLGMAGAVSLLVCVIGFTLFERMKKRFADLI